MVYQPNIVSMDSTAEVLPSSAQILNDMADAVSPEMSLGLGNSPMNIRPPIYAAHWSSQLPPANPGLYSKGS